MCRVVVRVVFGVMIVMMCSGCTMWESLIGQRVRPSDVDSTAAAGSLSFERNQCGEIVAVCCQTACTKAEKAAEFEKEFKDAVRRAVSDRRLRREIATQVTFVREHAKACNASSAMKFSIRLPSGASAGDVTIDLEDLAGSGPHPDRDALQRLFEQWMRSASSGSGAKLEITIKVCPSGGAASSVATSCLPPPDVMPVRPTFGGEPGGHQHTTVATAQRDDTCSQAVCEPCTIPPSIDREYRLNWDGII